MVRGWTMVCAGMILAGQQLSPAWSLAGDPNAASPSSSKPRSTTVCPGTCARCWLHRKASLASSPTGTLPID